MFGETLEEVFWLLVAMKILEDLQKNLWSGS